MTFGNMISNGSEQKEAQAIRDQKGQKTGESELDGELHGEKEAESPDPRKGDGISPEENIQKTKPRSGESGSSHGVHEILVPDRRVFNLNG